MRPRGARAHRLDEIGMPQRLDIAGALQGELLLVHRLRDVDRQHQFDVHGQRMPAASATGVAWSTGKAGKQAERIEHGRTHGFVSIRKSSPRSRRNKARLENSYFFAADGSAGGGSMAPALTRAGFSAGAPESFTIVRPRGKN